MENTRKPTPKGLNMNNMGETHGKHPQTNPFGIADVGCLAVLFRRVSSHWGLVVLVGSGLQAFRALAEVPVPGTHS